MIFYFYQKQNITLMKMKKTICFILLSIIFYLQVNAQDPHRFDEEINKFSKLTIPENEDLIVFTGSSSIRFWENLAKDCDSVNVVNTGFGGSQMSDLLYFLDQTVLRFKPTEVYIYEGDNDIAAEKSPQSILKTTKLVVEKILKSNPQIKIHFISAKPSPSRWSFKNQYVEFNTLLQQYCATHHQLFFVDVWNPMIGENERPKADIFISDSLHMNRKGYELWKEIICSDLE